jgi:apolipoprotein D and lipocalin family protein|tara:strand:- start:5545 stop:6087 length:543 start_codon:yes stop_codon:yes gene_type:complete
MNFKFMLLIIILFNYGCNGDNSEIKKEYSQLETVDYVDIEKFMGDWYVIANIPTFIEKRATNAIESYQLNDKGEVETTFTFYQDSPQGKRKKYSPKGFIFNTETNAEWRMQFLWPIKMPFLIIDLDEAYSYTVIGVPNRNYVWIMSREPFMDPTLYEKIITKLKEVDYDTSKIKIIRQEW